MTARIVKAYRVTVVWADRSITNETFSVSEFTDPGVQARKTMARYLKHDSWIDVRVTKIYAELGERVALKAIPNG